MYANILVDKKDGIATITINRPQVMNALDIKTREELLDAVQDIARDDSVRVVVFTGAGDKAFIAGADIRVWNNLPPSGMLDFLYNQGSLGLFKKIEELDKPTIAAINGYALGGGCEFAQCCDIRIAAENARFGQPEINLGFIPGGGGTQRLPRLIGMGRAKELCFTGDMIDAREAERIGLVNRVVPQQRLMETVLELAAKIASKSPLILKYMKRTMNYSMQADLDAGLLYEAQSISVCFSTEDKKEGVDAFLQKRRPQFKGK